MRKIVLFISMISFVFSNAQTKLEKDYNKIPDQEGKLDYIFKHIIKKQIEDYKLLEKKIDTLKTENKRLKGLIDESKKKDEIISDLKKVRTDLNKQIISKDGKIKTITTEREAVKNKNIKLRERSKNSKENIRKAINSIIQQKSSKTSGKLAGTIKEMAEEYDDIETSDLESYINMNKKFVTAKDLLSDPYDDININKSIDDLGILNINNKFSGLLEEDDKIMDLLLDYQSMCQKLQKEFQKYIDLEANAKYIKESLGPKEKEYEDYPYLSSIITQKLKSPIKTNFSGCN